MAFEGYRAGECRTPENALFQRQTGLIHHQSAKIYPMQGNSALADNPRKGNHMTSTHVLAFNRALSQARSTVRHARSEVIKLTQMRKDISKVTKPLAGCMSEADSMNLFMVGDKPHVQITMNKLESFKCLALMNMLWTLDTMGTVTNTKDWPEYLNREYRYDVSGISVCVNAYVKSDSPTCRKVVIGVETKTEPLYRIECD